MQKTSVKTTSDPPPTGQEVTLANQAKNGSRMKLRIERILVRNQKKICFLLQVGDTFSASPGRPHPWGGGSLGREPRHQSVTAKKKNQSTSPNGPLKQQRHAGNEERRTTPRGDNGPIQLSGPASAHSYTGQPRRRGPPRPPAPLSLGPVQTVRAMA